MLRQSAGLALALSAKTIYNLITLFGFCQKGAEKFRCAVAYRKGTRSVSQSQYHTLVIMNSFTKRV